MREIAHIMPRLDAFFKLISTFPLVRAPTCATDGREDELLRSKREIVPIEPRKAKNVYDVREFF